MDNKRKVLEIFRLLRLLNTPPALSAGQLQNRLGLKKSSFYRQMEIIRELGYEIEKDANGRFSLKFSLPKSGDGLLTLQDINLIRDLLKKETDNIHAVQLYKKLRRNLELIPIADALPQLHRNHVLQLIRAGINSGQCLELVRYRSLASQTVTNRRVEPLELTEDERYLIGWDITKDDQRQFKIERIEDVNILSKSINPERVASPMDIFGLTGNEWIDVRLELSKFAHHLLVEEFPLSRHQVRTVKGQVIYEGRVRSFKGIGRFVLGLPGEVRVLGPAGLVGYVRGKREAEFRGENEK